MKLGKRSRWMIISIILFTVLVTFLTRIDFVQAISEAYADEVLVRVETEIMQKTPAGQYYNSLLLEHLSEFNQIVSADPGHQEVLVDDILVFIPELKALLDGRGDTVQITSEHVKRLKAELDWFASRGSPALGEDIQNEQQRFPLDNFVGMTMSDALELINSKVPLDTMPKQNLLPDVTHHIVTPNPPVKRTLVPGSDGKWAYYVHNGVYFEYPANLSLKKDVDYPDFVSFALSPNKLEPGHLGPFQVHIWTVAATEKDIEDPKYMGFGNTAPNIMRKSAIQTAEFKGVEFTLGSSQGLIVYLYAFQYNYEHQLAVDILMRINENFQTPDGFDKSATMEEKYEYFRHMVDSVHIQEP